MRTLLLSIALLSAVAAPCLAISINEIRIDQPGADNDEYFELAGTSGTPLDTLTYLVIGDNPVSGSGVIEAIVSLANQFIPDDGYFLAVESTFGTLDTPFAAAMPDLTTALNFENSDNVTHLLVEGFFGSMGEDLDTDDDGMLDLVPWTTIVDGVALLEDPTATTSEHFYASTVVGPDESDVPGHVFRIPDENGPFQIGFFPDPGDPDFQDTPGRPNDDTGNPVGCDFNGDGACDCADVNPLVAKIAGGINNTDYDVNGDGTVDIDDLGEWLMLAGERHLVSGLPYLMGDANLDGTVDGQDFIAWNDHKFTSTPAWCAGDFNADGIVDGQDFVQWNNHKFMSADGLLASVPEPSGWAGAVLVAWAAWRGKRRNNFS